MSKTISTRLEDNEDEKLDKITGMEKIDRSSLIRKFLLEQIKIYEMKRVSEYYRKGLISGWNDFAVGFRCAKDAEE